MQVLSSEDRSAVISGLDPRARTLGALALAVLFVSLQQWQALSAALLLTVLLVAVAGAFTCATLRRLVELNLFFVFLLVFTPLSMPGSPVFSVGGLTWSLEGAEFALMVGVKANTVMLLCSALLGSMEPADLAHALYQMKLSPKLAHALFFCIRYLDVLHMEYHRLMNAMKLRAFRPRLSIHSLRSLGFLTGMLFLRSIDRSERILEAMKCRGFDGKLYSLVEFKPGINDGFFALIVAVAGCGVALLEWGI
jgi:cobalt/nickel transport system permease protein